MMYDRQGKTWLLFPAAGISRFRPRQSLLEGLFFCRGQPQGLRDCMVGSLELRMLRTPWCNGAGFESAESKESLGLIMPDNEFY